MVLGTPKYISPEQCDGREHLSGKSDVYSLGIILYEMLAGAAPFHAKAAMAFMRQHMVAIPPPLRERAPHVPKELHDLIHAMLAKEPAGRPDMTQVAERLRRILAPSHAGSTQIVPLPPRPGRTGFWLGGVALAAVALTGVFFFTQVRRSWLPLKVPVADLGAVVPPPLPTPRPDLASAPVVPPVPKVALPAEPLDAGTVLDAGAADLAETAPPDQAEPEPEPTDTPEPPPAEVKPSPIVKPVAKHAPVVKPASKHQKPKPPAHKPEPKRHGGKHGKHSRSHASRRSEGGRTHHS